MTFWQFVTRSRDDLSAKRYAFPRISSIKASASMRKVRQLSEWLDPRAPRQYLDDHANSAGDADHP